MTETYSLSSDFPDGLDSSKLEIQIRDSSITINLVGISSCEDVVDITFESSLDPGDKTILDGIVAAHEPDPPSAREYVKLSVNGTCSQTEYELLYVFAINDKYPITINDIGITSKMTGDISSYDVRVYDVTNDNIIASANFTNTDFELQSLGTISNAPTTEELLEIHVKNRR